MLPSYPFALSILNTLRQRGFTAYFAGGCVRDHWLGRPPLDYDIATSATPPEVMALFPKVIPVGVEFGVVLVVQDSARVEVTTFRRDKPYRDGRHPEGVEFCPPQEDAQRRDFTINGLFYSPEVQKSKSPEVIDSSTPGLLDFSTPRLPDSPTPRLPPFDPSRVIDYVGGLEDLKKKQIRAIGDPFQRFQEDYLRLLRAIKFATELDFSIEENTWRALAALHAHISEISGERIREELKRILTHPHNRRRGLTLLYESGLLETLLPEVTAGLGVSQPPEFHPEGDVFTHTFLAMDKLKSSDFVTCLATLLHDIGKPPTFTVEDRIRFNSHDQVGAEMAEKICDRLRLSSREKEQVVWLIRKHLVFKDVRSMRTSTLKKLVTHPWYPQLLDLYQADKMSANGNLDDYEFLESWRKKWSEEELRPKSLLNGRDLIRLRFTPGPLFSTILKDLETQQLEGTLTTQEEAIQYVKTMYCQRPTAD